MRRSDGVAFTRWAAVSHSSDGGQWTDAASLLFETTQDVNQYGSG